MKPTESRGQNEGRGTSCEDVIIAKVRDNRDLRVVDGP